MSCEENPNIIKGILETIVHKVPGNPVQSKKEKQGYVNLSEKSKPELLELIERQNKLLKNKEFLSKLPDKGEKISNYKHQLEEELRNREKSDQLSEMLSKLNIDGKAALDKLEWVGNCNPGLIDTCQDTKCYDDFDVEETDPLKIIANHSGTVFHRKINRILPPEQSLIKPSDIANIEKEKVNDMLSYLLPADQMESQKVVNEENETLIEEPYIKNLCDKFDKLNNTKTKEKFLPHKSIKRTVDEVLKKEKKENPKIVKWEVTAATPPPPVYNDTKLLPLEESVKLQIHQAEKLKEIQLKHATEKLKSVTGRGIGFNDLRMFEKDKFRNPQKHYDSSSSGEDDDEDDKQSFHSCHDEEEDVDEKRGGITFYNLIDN